MTEYDKVVHVETLDEYRTVLETWFKKGYGWASNPLKRKFWDNYFTLHNARYLVLDDKAILNSTGEAIDTSKAMSFNEFMAKERDMITYEVSEGQLGFIREGRESPYPASYLTVHNEKYDKLFSDVGYGTTFERDLLKYIAGDENVVFKVKDPRFMLKGKDTDGDIVYFTVDGVGAPTYTYDKPDAFIASHEEITCWNTPFWEIVRVDA